MDTLTLRVAARYSMAARTSYLVDRSAVHRQLRRYNDPKVISDSKKDTGGYFKARFEFVPISKVELPDVWNPGRAERIREGINEGKKLPPVYLSGDYEISDGIHRTNVSKEMGFSHVPAIVTEWVDTPEEMEPPEPEKRQLDIGDWVKTKKKWRGREYGWIDEQLRFRFDKGVKRWVYGVALIKKGDDWPDTYDLTDTDFDPVEPPPWAKKVKDEIEKQR